MNFIISIICFATMQFMKLIVRHEAGFPEKNSSFFKKNLMKGFLYEGKVSSLVDNLYTCRCREIGVWQIWNSWKKQCFACWVAYLLLKCNSICYQFRALNVFCIILWPSLFILTTFWRFYLLENTFRRGGFDWRSAKSLEAIPFSGYYTENL